MAKTKKELDKEKRAAEQAKAKADREAKAKARAEERAKEKAVIEAEKTRYKSLSPEEKKAEDRKRASEAEKKQVEEIRARSKTSPGSITMTDRAQLRKAEILENPLSYDPRRDRNKVAWRNKEEQKEFEKRYEEAKKADRVRIEKETEEKKKTDPYLLMDQLRNKKSQDLYKKTLADYGGELGKREIDTLLAYDQSLSNARYNTKSMERRADYADVLADTEYEYTKPLVESLDYFAGIKKRREADRQQREFDRQQNISSYLDELSYIDDFIKNPDYYRQTYAYAQDYDVDLQDQIARRAQIQRELGSLKYQGPERTSAMPNYAPVALAAEPVVAAPVTQPSSMTMAKAEPQGLPKVLEMKEAAAQPVYELPQEPIAVAQPPQPAPQPPQPAPQPTGLASLPPQRMSQAEIDAYAKTYNAYTPNTQISTGTYDPALEQKLGMTLNQVLQPNTTTTMKRGGYVKPKVPVKKKSGYVSKNQSKTASRRGDGIAQRGKTRGRMV